MEVSDELIEQLKSPLKPVLRIASEEDREQRASELAQKGADALPIFKEMAVQTNEDMHPVFVEFLLMATKRFFILKPKSASIFVSLFVN